MLIYRIINNINGMVYIGQTTQSLKRRWAVHKSEHKRVKYNTYLYNAMRKYGIENFSIEEIARPIVETQEALDKLEIELIKSHNSTDRSIGYNIDLGGKSGRKMSDESKKKLSEIHLGDKNAMHGKTHTDEVKAKMSKARKGKTQSKEWIEKRVASVKKNKKKRVSAFKGKKHSEESIRKMKEAHKGHVPWNKGLKKKVETKTEE